MSIIPHFSAAVHVDGGLPVLGADVVVFGLPKVRALFKLLRGCTTENSENPWQHKAMAQEKCSAAVPRQPHLAQVQMGLGQKVGMVLFDQPHHVVVVLDLFVHVNGEVPASSAMAMRLGRKRERENRGSPQKQRTARPR